MNVMLASVGAAILYTLGFIALCFRMTDHGDQRKSVLVLTLLGVIFQVFALYLTIHAEEGINLSLLNISSLIALMVTVVVLLSSLRKPAESLLLAVLPFAVVSVLSVWLFPLKHIFHAPLLMVAHVLLSVVAYGLLMVAMFQALLLAFQERQLKKHNRRRFLKVLPPLQTMEKLLFEFLLIGVVLLTMSLVSGFIYIDDMFAKSMLHKTVLSLVAWALFTVLLLGRWLAGWRGQKAMRWTVSGFVLLILAYFGWRTVVDFILVR